MEVRAKKALGQHFLKDEGVARRIVDSFDSKTYKNLLEIGPGTGVLSKYLVDMDDLNFKLIEIDDESVDYLLLHYPKVAKNLYNADFLKLDLKRIFPESFCVIGNFPYNISSQIFFKILDYKEDIPQVVCMIQKEVAQRIASAPGNKDFGILSVLLQAWYDIEYLFTVPPGAFLPPPKVNSAVIRLNRNNRTSLGCDETLFKKIVKGCFGQRRKTIRNSIKPILAELNQLQNENILQHPFLSMRPEQLGVEEFIELTKLVSN